MLNSLTSLRFFFAFVVFLSHLTFVKTDLAWYNYLKNNVFFEGYLGVGFFFILSGFVIALNYEKKVIDNPNFDKKKFYIARIARIYPLHVLTFCVMLPFVIINVWQGYFHWDIAGANLFLLQSYIPVKDFYFSINNVSWSISTELFFYLMFPFYVIWLHKFPKLKYILLLIIPIIIFAEPYFRTNMKLEKAIFYINPIVRSFDFILGIITCQIYKKIKDTPINFSRGTLIEIAAITVLAIFFYFHNDVARAFRYGIYYWIPMVGIVLIFALQKGFFSRILQHKTLVYLGEISFAFYMIHMIVIKYGNQYLPKINDFHKIGIYFVIALILSALTFEYFEKPVAKWIKDKVK
ncbi:acyltransferase family protein [Empedobacter falsenii]|uniref:acyltransferase family protein n=1 Tax=Empedobacter falsenii TaxID=343874 RepID=UPI001C8E6922|nr:acyltransferase [Empedobacter falsenii]MBY0068227.1 acyltransferase [Empedobacter falsenii]